MGHKGNGNYSDRSLKSQGHVILSQYYHDGRGVKRGDNKLQGAAGAAAERTQIHTNTTYTVYMRAWDRYCDWLQNNNHGCMTIEEAEEYVQDYVNAMGKMPGKSAGSTMSAASISTNLAGVCKVTGKSCSEYTHPSVLRADIIRSRGTVENDKRFDETKNAEFVEFCKSTGLRKNKELSDLRGSDLIKKEDGKYYIHVVQGKGGRSRDAIICGSDASVAAVVARMQAAGDNKVWAHIPHEADVHSYRADYAQRIYDSVAREPAAIPPEDRYCCRGDKAGVWYDRVAMRYTSEQLGHSRVSVIAAHYLH